MGKIKGLKANLGTQIYLKGTEISNSFIYIYIYKSTGTDTGTVPNPRPLINNIK